jgi:DNA-binding winged helix-turn-helix (wHTH) protein
MPSEAAESAATSATGPFEVAGWRAEPETGRVARAGASVRLEPKVMDVLVYLARRSGRLVTRQDLEASVWAGTMVGYDAVTSAVLKLRKALRDKPREPRIIETLSKKGYRLVASVTQVYDAQSTVQADASTPTPARAAPSTRGVWRGLIAFLAIAAATTVRFGWRAGDEPASAAG